MQSKLTNVINKIPQRGDMPKKYRIMKATNQRNRARQVFKEYSLNPQFTERFTKAAMIEELEKVDKLIKRQLAISKDLRNKTILDTYLPLRHFYKELITLFDRQ